MKVDFAAGWNTLWAAATGAIPQLAIILAVIGTGLAALGVVKFISGKRKGGANPKELGWTLGFAALIIMPQVLIPLVLRLVSFVVNFFIGIANGFK